MVFIVAEGWVSCIKYLELCILAVDIATISPMRVGMSHALRGLEVSDTRLRPNSSMKNFTKKSKAGHIKANPQRRHESCKLLRSGWTWLFLCVRFVLGYD
jgi:hypothetical protein